LATLVGVVADTHVPQRLNSLPQGIAQALGKVSLILHAGDIDSRRVLDELGRLAPVVAVAGNADPPWLNLPRKRVVEVAGCRIGLAHGHSGWRRYLFNKVRERLGGYDGLRYVRYARQEFEAVDVIVTGHTHRPHLVYCGSVLLFNPGSVAPDYHATRGATVGILRIESGVARAELVSVPG